MHPSPSCILNFKEISYLYKQADSVIVSHTGLSDNILKTFPSPQPPSLGRMLYQALFDHPYNGRSMIKLMNPTLAAGKHFLALFMVPCMHVHTILSYTDKRASSTIVSLSKWDQYINCTSTGSIGYVIFTFL